MIASFVVLLFVVMNRVRGSSGESLTVYWGFPSKHSGSLIAALMFALICATAYIQMYYDWKSSAFLFLCCAVFYKLGETFGWGKWIGQMNGGPPNPNSDEGKSTGIHYLANLVFNEMKHTKAYASLALSLRGALWFSLAYAPLKVVGFLNYEEYCMLWLFSGISFPLAFYASSLLGDENYWKRGETLYGLYLGVTFISVLKLPMY